MGTRESSMAGNTNSISSKKEEKKKAPEVIKETFQKPGERKTNIPKLAIVCLVFILTLVTIGYLFGAFSYFETKSRSLATKTSKSLNVSTVKTLLSRSNNYMDTTANIPLIVSKGSIQSDDRRALLSNKSQKLNKNHNSFRTRGAVIKRDNNGLKNNFKRESQTRNKTKNGYFSTSREVVAFDYSGNKKSLLEDGEMIPVKLLSTVVVRETKVPARAITLEDAYDSISGELVIPSGSLIYVSFNGFNEQGRGFAKSLRVKIKGEKLKELKGDLLSSDESFGVGGMYFDNQNKLIAGSIASQFVSSFSQGFKSSMLTTMGDSIVKYSAGSLKNAFLNALEKVGLGEAKRRAEQLKSQKPYIIIPKGTLSIIMLGKNI